MRRDEALWQKLAAFGRECIRAHVSRDIARSAITRLIEFARNTGVGKAGALRDAASG